MVIHTKQCRTEVAAGSYLKLHHHVVETIVATASHKAAHVIFACGLHNTVRQSLNQSQQAHQLEVFGDALHSMVKRD